MSGSPLHAAGTPVTPPQTRQPLKERTLPPKRPCRSRTQGPLLTAGSPFREAIWASESAKPGRSARGAPCGTSGCRRPRRRPWWPDYRSSGSRPECPWTRCAPCTSRSRSRGRRKWPCRGPLWAGPAAIVPRGMPVTSGPSFPRSLPSTGCPSAHSTRHPC